MIWGVLPPLFLGWHPYLGMLSPQTMHIWGSGPTPEKLKSDSARLLVAIAPRGTAQYIFLDLDFRYQVHIFI